MTRAQAGVLKGLFILNKWWHEIRLTPPSTFLVLLFANSATYFGRKWWDRHHACHFLLDTQKETISIPEIRLGNDAGHVRRGSRTARNKGAASGAPTPRISPEAILRQSQMPALPIEWSRILPRRFQSENASPELRIGPFKAKKKQSKLEDCYKGMV